MKLYDEEELRLKNEKSKKTKNLILISIILIAVLIVLLMGVIYYLIYNPNKITIRVNGGEDEDIEQMIITKNTYDGKPIVYFPIRQIASKFGYSSNNGDYGRNVENTENCYIESENEVAIFTEDSNTIYKIDKTIAKNEANYKYEEITIENSIIKENDVLYADIEGLSESFNLNIEANDKMKRINIITLDSLIASAEKLLTDNKFGQLDEKFANRKALLDNMIVIKKDSENEQIKGVIDSENYEEILGFQYDDITYIPSNESFLIKKDEKFGIIGKDRIAKIKPQYDSLTLIDSNNGLYLAENNTFFGVIDENGNLKIHSEFKKIGVDVSQFKENDIKNGYVLFGNLIPAQRAKDDKWVFYKIGSTTNSDGKKNVECTLLIPDYSFDGIGCIVDNSRGIVNNLMVIKDYNLVVVQNNGYYGFMDTNGKPALALIYSSAYIETTSGVTDYYAVDKDGKTIKVIDEIKKKGYTKVN